MANSIGRGGIDLSRTRRTGSAGAHEDRVLDRIDFARPTRRRAMNDALCFLVTMIERSLAGLSDLNWAPCSLACKSKPGEIGTVRARTADSAR